MVDPAKQTIPALGKDPVAQIAEGFWDQPEERAERGTDRTPDANDRTAVPRDLSLFPKRNRIEVFPVLNWEELLGSRSLERGEMEHPFFVPSEKFLHAPITESAFSVEKDDRPDTGGEFRSWISRQGFGFDHFVLTPH